MKVKGTARKVGKPKVAAKVRDSRPPHASPRAKPPVKKSDRASAKPASVHADPPAPLAEGPQPVELPGWVAALEGELAGAHLAIRAKLPAKKNGRISRRQAFLAAFVQCSSVTRAAQAAGVCREMHYEWLETDAKYAAAFEAVRDQAAQVLEDEAVRRAYEGTLKPVYYVGQLCGVQREYSDGMLQMLLKGMRRS